MSVASLSLGRLTLKISLTGYYPLMCWNTSDWPLIGCVVRSPSVQLKSFGLSINMIKVRWTAVARQTH